MTSNWRGAVCGGPLGLDEQYALDIYCVDDLRERIGDFVKTREWARRRGKSEAVASCNRTIRRFRAILRRWEAAND